MILMTEKRIKVNLLDIISGEGDWVFQLRVIAVPKQHVVHV